MQYRTVLLLMLLTLPLFFFVSCAHNDSRNNESGPDETTPQNFHLQYFNHCSKIQKDTHPQTGGLSISHLGLKNFIAEDSCRIIRLHNYITHDPNFCKNQKSSSLKKLSCFEMKLQEMVEKAPLNPQTNLVALGIGLSFLADDIKDSHDPYLYASAVADFTLLILESLATLPNYHSYFPEFKYSSLEEIPLAQWKNFHPQLTNESSFTRDDEFPIFLLYSRLFADNFSYEMIDKVRQTLYYLESLPSAGDKNKQDQLLSLLQRYHKYREFYLQRFASVCDANIPSGCNQAGGTYLKSNKEIPQAVPFLEKSCSLLDGTGCGILGDYYQTEADYNRALKEYTFGCLYNNIPSCVLAGTLHYKRKEIKKSEEFYQTACDNSDEFGCSYLKVLKKGLHSKTKAPSSLKDLKGAWEGIYKCPQGTTNVTFTIKGEKNNIFSFNKDDKFKGSYKGQLKLANQTLFFIPDSHQITSQIAGDLKDWEAIGFSADIFPAGMVGKISNPNCEIIYLERKGTGREKEK